MWVMEGEGGDRVWLHSSMSMHSEALSAWPLVVDTSIGHLTGCEGWVQEDFLLLS